MYYYIPHTVIFLASIGILYILSKKVEAILRLPQKPEKIIPPQAILKNAYLRIKDWILGFKYESWGPAVLGWTEKRLRNLRIIFLKTDNWISWIIEKSKDKGQTWKIRSKAWSEQKRAEKLDKLKVLEKLDKVEFLEMIDGSNGAEEKEKKEEGRVKIKNHQSNDKKDWLAREKEYINKIAKNPKDKESYLALGKLYWEQKNSKDAEASFTQVLKIDSQNQEAKKYLEELKNESQIARSE